MRGDATAEVGGVGSATTSAGTSIGGDEVGVGGVVVEVVELEVVVVRTTLRRASRGSAGDEEGRTSNARTPAASVSSASAVADRWPLIRSRGYAARGNHLDEGKALVGTQPATEMRTIDDDVVDGGAIAGWTHVPALDGIRGIAVIAVLLFHGGVSWAKGGFLGVDAFFVLSGLLITSLLLDEGRRSGFIDLGRFWSRRARRLLPALLLVVAAAGLYGAVLAPRGSLAGLRKDAIATLFYVANWRYIQAGADYFEATAAPSVLRHTWSLAIEEQFYLVWPLVVWGLARLRTALHVSVGALAAVGTLASATAMWLLFQPGGGESRAYFGTDTRVQVVLTGAVLAALLAGWRRQRRSVSPAVGSALGVAAAVASVGFLAAVATVRGDETPLFRGGFLAVAIGVAVVLAHIVLVPGGWSSRAFAVAPLRWIGLLSYGLYLWHWPVFLTLTRGRTGLSGFALLAAKLTVTTVLSVASYYLVELPIRRGALPRMAGVVAGMLALALTAGAVIAGTELPPLQEPAAGAVARTASGFPASTRPVRDVGEPSRVLVVGDSIAKTLADRVARPASRAGLAMTNKGVLGCGVVRGGPYRYFGKQLTTPRECESWPRQWAEHINRYDPDVVLMTVGRWEVMDRMHAGQWAKLGDPAFDSYLEAELELAITVLGAGNAIVMVTTAPYFLRGERPDGGRWPEDDPARVDHFNALLRRVAERHPARVAVLDLNAQTSLGGQYTPVIDGVSLRFDGVHFSPEGARWLQPWLFAALLEVSPPVDDPGPTATTAPRATAPPTTRAPGATAPTTTAPTRASSTTAPPASTTSSSTTEPPSTTSTTEEPATTTTTSTTAPVPTLPSE